MRLTGLQAIIGSSACRVAYEGDKGPMIALIVLMVLIAIADIFLADARRERQ